MVIIKITHEEKAILEEALERQLDLEDRDISFWIDEEGIKSCTKGNKPVGRKTVIKNLLKTIHETESHYE